MKKFRKSIYAVSVSCGIVKLLRIMKLSTILLVIATLQVFAEGVYSQNAVLTLNLDESSVGQVLTEIENQSEFYFLFNQKLVDSERKVNVQLTNKKITEVLDQVFSGTTIEYVVMDRQIVLSPKEFLSEVKTSQQQRTLTGTVIDEDGNPLAGVTVLVKGTANGTITDIQGKYNLSNVPEDGILVFSFVGMLTQEIPVEDKTTIDITLKFDAIGIEEVVAIGYGTLKKGDITGAVGTVSFDDIESRVVPRLDEALQGKMAGVMIQQNSGLPGSAPVIRIRGTHSITENNQPLWVVDGMPIEEAGVIANMNMNDVASIEVLKDASSAAIYGSRASNGVILVTTKTGSIGKPVINYSMYFGTQRAEKRMDMLTGPEEADYLVERREWQISQNPNFDLSMPNDQLPANLRIDPNWRTGNVENYDIQDLIFQNAPVQNHNLSVSGGTENTQYLMSVEYLNQEGITIGTAFERYAFRMNLQSKINKRFTVGLNLAPSISTQYDANTEGKDATLTSILMYYPLNDITESYFDEELQIWKNDYSLYYGLGSNANRWYTLNHLQQEYKRNQILSNGFLDVKLFDGLTFRSVVYYRLSGLKFSDYRNTAAGDGRRNTTLGNDYTSNITWENTLNYNKDFGKHSINGLLVYSVQKSYFESTAFQGQGFTNDTKLTINNAAEINSWDQNIQEWALISMLGRIIYNYDSRYLISASLRRDGCSRFGANNKWGLFPAVSGAWRISEESFMDAQDLFSNLKLRGSYGVTGNNRIGNYSAYANLLTSNATLGRDAHNVIGLIPGSFANPDLTWEKSATTNIGLDLGIIKNRVILAVDVYSTITNDMLLEVPIPHTTGYYTAIQNIGKLSNKGFEIEINTRNFVASDFKWNTNIVFGYNKNEVLELGPTGAPIQNGPFWARDVAYTGIGESIGSFWLWETDGIFMTQEEVDAAALYADEGVGDVKFVDQNGDGVVDLDDRKIMGQPTPRYNFGITNTFTYKGFDLNVFINGSGGHQSFLGISRYISRPSVHILMGEYRNRWRSPEDPGNGIIPRVTSDAQTNGATEEHSRWLYDSDWWRIKNVSLGYTIPSSVLSKVNIASLRVYVSADNLYLNTDYPGYNPEGGQNYAWGLGTSQADTPADADYGFDFGSSPLAKRFIIGLNITF